MDKRKRKTKIDNPIKDGVILALEALRFSFEVLKEHERKIFMNTISIIVLAIAFIIHVLFS